MGSATILMPQAVFCFTSEPNIPEGSEYEKSLVYFMLHAGMRKFRIS